MSLPLIMSRRRLEGTKSIRGKEEEDIGLLLFITAGSFTAGICGAAVVRHVDVLFCMSTAGTACVDGKEATGVVMMGEVFLVSISAICFAFLSIYTLLIIP